MLYWDTFLTSTEDKLTLWEENVCKVGELIDVFSAD